MVLTNPFSLPLPLFRSQFAMPKILALQVLALEALHNKWKRKSEKYTISQIFHRPKAFSK